MEKFRNADPRLLTILLIIFVQILGASLVLPILPLFALQEFAMSPQVITLLVSAFFAAQFVAGPWIGRLSDRYGRLPVLIVSQIGTAISFLMLALAQDVPTLFVARIVDGITGGNIIVAQAYITDITPRERRTQSLGYTFAAFGLGFIFGPALGGVLSAAFGPRLPFVVAAIAAALTVLLTWITLDETVTPEQKAASRAPRPGGDFRTMMDNSALLLVLLIAFVGQFAFGLMQGTFSLYGEAVLFQGYDQSTTLLGIGLLLAVVGLTQFSVQMWLLDSLVQRFGDAWLVIGGNLLRVGAFLLYAVITSPWLGAIGSVLFASGMGIMTPPLQALATRAVPDEERGGVLGIFQSAQSLATIVSTAVAGVLFAIAPTFPYWTGAALSLVVLVPSFVLLRHPAAQPQQREPTNP
jgi:MFS transporter, DHA1 family, tetracycline resistance protein